MKKFLFFLFIIFCCSFHCISQNTCQDNIFYSNVLNYKNWLLKNQTIQPDTPKVWVLYIYKSNISQNNFEFLLSFSVIKTKPGIFKGYFMVENELVLVNSRAKDTMNYTVLNIKNIDGDLIAENNKKLFEERNILFDPCYRFIKFKNGKIKIKDLKKYTDLPKKYWAKNAE
ncbi:MAG TPA: hypothetical protein PKI01_05875 [Bacteroidales bacterium]|nr:hypothetical protein [Bacteroidales bacterium]